MILIILRRFQETPLKPINEATPVLRHNLVKLSRYPLSAKLLAEELPSWLVGVAELPWFMNSETIQNSDVLLGSHVRQQPVCFIDLLLELSDSFRDDL